MNFQMWITPVLFVVGGVLIGFLLDRFVVRRFRNFSASTPWLWDNVLWQALSGFPSLWFFLGGLYGAVLTAPISAGQMKHGQRILLIVAILSITVAIARLITGFGVLYSKRSHGQLPSATILANLTRIFVYLLGLLTIFYTFGINITPALTALGIGGLAVALALQDTLSNFFAGLQIIASRQISPGDLVKLSSGDEGFVADITWRNTTVRTFANNLVVIPNSKIASDIFTNYHLPEREMAVIIQVGVSYDSDLQTVEGVTLEVATQIMKEVPGGIADFRPLIRYQAFGDSSINFFVILRAKEFTDQGLIKHEFIKKLHERYKRENIEIPFPIRTVHLQQHLPES